MGVCPNIKLPEWKRLVAAKGEREAYYLWAKYNGEVPEIEFRDAPIDDLFDSQQADDTPSKVLSDKETFDVIQEMTFLMLNDFIKSDENLFNIEKINASTLYNDLKVGVLATIKGKENAINDIINNNKDLTKAQKERLEDIIKNNRQLMIDVLKDWPRLEAKHREYIRAYSVEFDENDSLQLNDEDRVRESNRFDASKIDNFRKANVAIKLLLAANPIVDESGNNVVSSIGGRLLVPSSKTFITLMSRLHTSRSVEEMIERLKNLAIEDSTYEMLYSRLTRSSVLQAGVDFSNIDTTHGIQLLSGLWKTFKKYAPDVKNIFIFENGEIAVGDAALSSAALQLRDKYIGAISTLSKANKGFFDYDEKKRKYIVNRSKLNKINLTTKSGKLNFLSTLGINFSPSDYNKLSPANKKKFEEVLGGLVTSLSNTPEISTFSTRSLDVNKRLLELGIIQEVASNPEFSSTYFNLQGERVQVFMGTNAVSELHDTLASISNLNQLAGTKYEYLLKDVFSKGSNLLRRMFTEDGKKKAGADELLKPGYVGGIDNKIKNRLTTSSRLTARQRFIQELNLNRNGQYINLVPGDASLEHMIYMGNPLKTSDLVRGMADINAIFKEYFLSEVRLSREDRPVAEGRDSKDLRFFKGILGDKLHNEIVSSTRTPEELYKLHGSEIASAVRNFILKDVSNTVSYMNRFGMIVEGDKFIEVKDIEGLSKVSKDQFTNEMILMSVNYAVANIEMHKLIYSDPYQYKDELKRIKSFLSPRQAIVSNSPKMNVAYNTVFNEGYSKDDIGYTNFTQDYFKTVSHKDVLGVINLPGYGQFKETDGGGSILYKAYRNFRIRSADWNENEEKQFRYEVAWEKRDKGLTLLEEENKLLKEGNPKIKSAFDPLKPITSGTKLDKNGNPSPYNNIVLDKFSLYPLSYRVMKELGADNGVRLYNKMQKENVDYMVFESGRKVGAENSHDTYVESTQQPSGVATLESNLETEITKELKNKTFKIGKVPFKTIELKDVNLEIKKVNDGQFSIAVNNKGKTIFGKTTAVLDFQRRDLDSDNIYIPNPQGFILWNKFLESDVANMPKSKVIVDNRFNITLGTLKGLKSSGISKLNFPERFVENFKNEYSGLLDTNFSSVSSGDTTRLNTVEVSIDDLIRILTTKIKRSQQTDKGVAVFNDAEYESIVNVPLSAISLQSEVRSKDKALVTRGSQITKLITMDLMENGVPVDYKGGFDKWLTLSNEEKEASSDLYKEIVNNQKLLEEMTNEGYQGLLKRLGLSEVNGEIVLDEETGRSKVVETLREEIFRRETNDNISDALTAFLNGDDVLEATPAYQIVRNILYSIVDKQIVSPKISGSQLVQISSALFEANRIDKTEINGKEGYTSDILKFYENKDGERVMEVMVGRWFNSDMSDEDLLDYLNNTEEGQKILSGVAFRIPTQAQNSIDAFKIKKFLPQEFGGSVVVPSAIVEKVGSDFDIDKLSMYFKNVFYQNGKLKMVPYFGMGKEAKDKFSEMFDKGELLDKKQQDALGRILADFNAGNIKIEQDEELNNLLSKLGMVSEEDVVQEFAETLKELDLKDAIVNRLYKQSLENEFIQSSENIITSKENFKNLIKPNDSSNLEDIAKEIIKRTTGKAFDYSDLANMLDRRFMSRLRQAFVSGKQAIGIAAVNQTNHSLNQRGVIYVNKDNLKYVPLEDARFLGDGVIKFAEYNKVKLDGKEYPSLSGINNVDGKLISNINSQFIDGYVDIAAGPWIMEMGATPNLTSTFMFLVKIGVPVDTVAYFMNQPIIRDHIRSIENAGYKFIFIDDFIGETIANYGGLTEAQEKKLPKVIPSKASLLGTLGKEKLTPKENLDQIFILKEFLKYSKMANQLYTVTQGTNWDTTNFNDPSLVFKKNVQFSSAQNTIISSADDILNNSYIGNLADKINDSRDAISNFLVSDAGRVRDVLEQVLMPYVNLPNKVFVKVARKATNDLFDWAVQTDQNLNKDLQKILLADNGVGSQVLSFIDTVKKNPKHPLYNNQIIDILEVQSSRAAGNTPTNLKLANKDNKVYDQNNIIYSFRELKEYLKGETSLYDKIVELSVLQSGLNNSPISFTSLIPYEDFSRIYNKTLSRIEKLPNLQDFHNLSVFQRNNWNDSDIVPSTTLNALKDKNGRLYYPSISFFGYNNLRGAIKAGDIPQLVSGGRGGEFEVFSWTDLSISATERAAMRKAGDYSYINRGLYKKVYDADKITPITTDSNGRLYFVYKPINALGDSFRANEFYTEAKESIIDNRMMKVENEVIDEQIIPYMVKSDKKKSYTKVEEGDLVITVKGDRITVNNRSFAASMINFETLTGRLGYTPEQAGEIINAKCKG